MIVRVNEIIFDSISKALEAIHSEHAAYKKKGNPTKQTSELHCLTKGQHMYPSKPPQAPKASDTLLTKLGFTLGNAWDNWPLSPRNNGVLSPVDAVAIFRCFHEKLTPILCFADTHCGPLVSKVVLVHVILFPPQVRFRARVEDSWRVHCRSPAPILQPSL